MNNRDNSDTILNEQIAYYKARSGEYDEWFFRQGRYDRGPELNKLWFDELEIVRQALYTFNPAGNILELACGTGLWTQHLLPNATRITAVDAVDEVIAINKNRLQSPLVQYIKADIFEWTPDNKYEVIFFAFWLSHVPAERFETFWALIDDALIPGGRVFLIDSLYDWTSTARDHLLGAKQDTMIKRRLNDGREFSIVKVFHQAKQLSNRLQNMGWQFTLKETPHYFLYGYGAKSKMEKI